MSRHVSSQRYFLSALLIVAAALAGISIYSIVSETKLRAQTDPNVIVPPSHYQSLRWRSVGPHRGGRVTAVAGVRTQPNVFYMGATGGGVFKTINYGITWEPTSDGQITTGSIGAIEVADSNPNIVYVGTGSDGIRSNVIIGKGVYRSIDAGKTWTFIGLKDAGQIGAVVVHPTNPDIVYVAAIGNPFGPNSERGVFRTKDGGKTWQKVLFINERTGVAAVAMNWSNPNELYAGAWRGERKPWTIISGGPASEGGIYKSTDGGDNWTHLTAGLPQNLIGKIDLDVARSKPNVVYALVEAPGNEGGVYRSDDSGATWRLMSSDAALRVRPFYFNNIDVNPKNENEVWVNSLNVMKSVDGGKTWAGVRVPHGDSHGIWFNPDNPLVAIQCNDGGANVTQDGGRSWSSILNQPTAEIYMVDVDNQFPYRIYGPQQDNSTFIVYSLPPYSWNPEPEKTWMQGPGCETGQIRPQPSGKIVYGVCKGEFGRYNIETGQEKHYWIYPQNRYGHNPKDMKYRFVRQSPIEVSPHDPKVVYHGSQYLHHTIDDGVTWERISPDLTANDPDKQVISGEPITRDITGEEVYSALYAIRESRLERGVIWTGSNDGPVHVTRDGGKTWKNVTPKDLPRDSHIQNIEDSPHRKGSAYIAAYRFMLSDWQPYIFVTNDYGATWTRLTDGMNGIPADYPTRVVREDPEREGLLYAGTEFGAFVSFDQGKHWQTLQQNLPVTPVTDIKVHRKDLVISTMGRSFWIMDNITPLEQLAQAQSAARANAEPRFDATAQAYLFQPREAYRMRYAPSPPSVTAPEYPPNGAQLDYYLASEPADEVKLEILDAAGKVVRSFISGQQANADQAQGMRSPRGAGAFARPTKKAGLNRFVWDLRYAGVDGAGFGPLAVPGRYQVRLSIGSWNQTRPLEIRIDPRVAADGVTIADLREQLDFSLKVNAAISEARRLAARIREARERMKDHAEASAKLRDLSARVVTAGGAYPQPMLIDQFSNIARMIGQADQKVGRDAFERYDDLMKELNAIRTALDQLAGATTSQPSQKR
jgi:photosystem II stability/assembly factor-like uncharacterized protein